MEPSPSVRTHVKVPANNIKDGRLGGWILPCGRNAERPKADISKMIVTIVLLIASSQIALGTTIVIIWTPNQVVMAADSQGTFTGGIKRPVCKIYALNGAFFGVGALVGDDGFSVPRIIRQLLGGKPVSQTSISAIEEPLRLALAAYVPSVQKKDPTQWEKLRTEGVSTVVFVGYEALRGAFVEGRSFRWSDRRIVDVFKDGCPHENICGQIKVFWLGQHSAIERYITSPNFRMDGMAPIDLARTLVQLEIDGKADGVAGPIDILSITSRGARWVQKKNTCPADIK